MSGHLERAAAPAIPAWNSVRLDALLLPLATVAGALLRLVGLGRNSFWTDELYVVWEGRQPLSLVLDPSLHIQHPPGYRLAQHAWMGINLSEAWIRLLPALCGIALVPVIWAIARALWPGSRRAALLAAILAATSPFLVHYSQDATTYSWSTLWLAVSFLLLVHAWRSNRAILWAAWAISLAICLYSHYFTFFPLLVEGAGAMAVGISGGAEARARLRGALLAVLGAVALYSPWLWALITANSGTLLLYLSPLTVDTQILHWLPTLLVGYSHAGFWQNSLVLAAMWLAVAGAAAWVTLRYARQPGAGGRRALALVAAWAFAATVGPYLFLRVTSPPGADDPVRFAAMSTPALLLGAGLLLSRLPGRAAMAVVICWVVVYGVQRWGEYTSAPAEDWRSVLGTVADGARPGDVLLAFPAFHAGAAAAYYSQPLDMQGGWFVDQSGKTAQGAYWFVPGWRWRGFLDTRAQWSTDWTGEIATRTAKAERVWYLAGDGVNGTYPGSRAAEQSLSSQGWRVLSEWHESPLVLRLYDRSAQK